MFEILKVDKVYSTIPALVTMRQMASSKTKKIKGSWVIDAYEDLNALFSEDIADTVTKQIQKDIDNEIISGLNDAICLTTNITNIVPILGVTDV